MPESRGRRPKTERLKDPRINDSARGVDPTSPVGTKSANASDGLNRSDKWHEVAEPGGPTVYVFMVLESESEREDGLSTFQAPELG